MTGRSLTRLILISKVMNKLKLIPTLCLAAYFTGFCLITDMADIKPIGAKKGYEVKRELEESARLILMLTQYLFLESFLFILPQTSGYLEDAYTAGFLAPLLTDIDDERYYTGSSVKECIGKMESDGMTVVAAFVYNLRKDCGTAPTPGCISSFNSKYDSSFGLAGFISNNCNLEKTGTIFHFTDDLSL